MLVSRAIVQLIAGGKTLTGEKSHSFDPRQQPSQRRGPLTAIRLIQGLNDQSHTLCFLQPKLLLGFENTMWVDRLGKLSH
jgi:hypothetical protein